MFVDPAVIDHMLNLQSDAPDTPDAPVIPGSAIPRPLVVGCTLLRGRDEVIAHRRLADLPLTQPARD